jgi:hypothetical protein
MFVPFNNRLRTSRGIRCQNLILHPNGRLYGDISGLGCPQFVVEDDRIIFIDHLSRVRYIFLELEAGVWKSQARLKPDSGVQHVHRDTLILRERGPMPMLLAPVDYQLLRHPELPSRRSFEIVVAKFKEDVSWTDCYPANATVYSKDQDDNLTRYVKLPNLGREGGSYLHHIVNNYDQLAARTFFAQGDPFPHPTIAISDYATNASPFAVATNNVQSMDWTVPWSKPDQRMDSRVLQDFLRLTECDPTIQSFRWTQGAQFALDREQIQKRSRSYYQRLLTITQQKTVSLDAKLFDNHSIAWLFELFWRNIFMAEKLS